MNVRLDFSPQSKHAGRLYLNGRLAAVIPVDLRIGAGETHEIAEDFFRRGRRLSQRRVRLILERTR